MRADDALAGVQQKEAGCRVLLQGPSLRAPLPALWWRFVALPLKPGTAVDSAIQQLTVIQYEFGNPYGVGGRTADDARDVYLALVERAEPLLKNYFSKPAIWVGFMAIVIGRYGVCDPIHLGGEHSLAMKLASRPVISNS